MSIFVIGVNHKTAPVAIREKVAFDPSQLNRALKAIHNFTPENIILSTCNRTELYIQSKQEDSIKQLTQWLAEFHQIPQQELTPYLYVYEQEKAIQHILRVACGLDSLVLGEPQILGQLKEALRQAKNSNTTGAQLTRLMQHTFSTAKKVRTQTSIGANPISVAFAAVSLAKQIFSQLEQQTALLVGAGETIELVGKHLVKSGIGHIIVANRSVDKAETLANEYNGQAIGLNEMADHLYKADIVISSTAAPVAIIGKGMVERALKERRHRPMFMVDIAVPRDIEPEVAELDDAYLYTVDDLQSVIEENLQSRRHAAEQAESMVLAEVQTFIEWQRAQHHVDAIKLYRQKVANIRDEVLEKAQAQLQNKSAEEALNFLAHTLSNKLSHDMTQSMNQAARQGQFEQLEAAKNLLNLNDSE